MKKLLIFIICFIAISCFTFCSAEELEQAGVVEAQQGQNFTITLGSNKTTGYEWQFSQPLNKSMVQLISSKYLANKTQFVGVGGRQIWTLKALKPGKTTIYFEYVRPWEKDIPPANEASFEIVIKK
jgi:inhibitor of cysteine peptidase